MAEPGLRSVLVANRGEIARRVMRTCREAGLRTVAVFTDADEGALHVREADDAVRVPSYLDVDAIVAAAVRSGAEAVHPGYGFLSERGDFARAVAAAGVAFVGPTPEVMDLMGRKDAAREAAVAAGVPVVPQGDAATPPLLVKAAAGGGGKGMRVVRDPAGLEDAIAAARREALAAFGDDTVLLERYVERGRHIEVQVLGDTHGSVIHLGVRDCSVQRRHQKVVEEAPAPTLDDTTRRRMTGAAVSLARSVGYVGAGTVEFLLDADSGEFYFLEMNTRLQVEHPVTELVTGRIDLVRHQLRIAAGHPLLLEQADIAVHGHAIEARVYAEDPYAGFLPQAGASSIVRWPEASTGRVTVRVDHALEGGQVVSTTYDPMLGKVIAHGPDRESARQALVDALDHTAVLGLTTNTGFLRDLVAGEAFRDAAIDTAWLDRHEPAPPDPAVARVMAAWVSALLTAADAGHAWQADGFRLGATPAPTVVELDRPVTVDRTAGTVDGVPVRQVSAADHVLVLEIDGGRERAVVNVQPGLAEVVHRGHRFVLTGPDRLARDAVVTDGTVLAPMPGTVLDVRVGVGDVVAADDVLGTVEAMKMELALRAPLAGTVAEVRASPGTSVALGDRLFVVEPTST